MPSEQTPLFDTIALSPTADHIAPDGSEVRPLVALPGGSMAHFTLPAGAVSVAVAHRGLDEAWYFISGRGHMWRAAGGRAEIVDLVPGLSITIPAGTGFQFRADEDEPLTAIGFTLPPWPGPEAVYPVDGAWPPTGVARTVI
ncbi:Mannose-6-phosphate isomerase, cupin superfamily [Kaistia soli DSM 19436]|uniref:Mannose-6-phosphate isomerase, cupin superfamily n=1 Tax=Kaistia soli DSM 19436 TaxID=1122133 RepID=A0A1M4X8N9_9HYPH|nr:cupin domain-containing protein [Kaistia soli]SHE89765.1 Mannose-6-phosphate isomerase, cupin superfamily [Kaistia soli DSM 19436]